MSPQQPRDPRQSHTWYLDEPRGETYRQLLRFAVGRVDRATLRPLGTVDPRYTHAINKLSPHQIGGPPASADVSDSESRRKRYVYRFGSDLANKLSELADGVFDWESPERPTDLVLLRGADDWLVSVAHERLCSITMAKDEFASLCSAVPSLGVQSGPGYRGGRR
ncbi:hypothetical protein [Sorangium sp. So ce1099]|uniref:hypothetical protein n=1 Tax=Sorangium sp. So ce1099 TaxID=3133331 RepID=UPI003F6385EC